MAPRQMRRFPSSVTKVRQLTGAKLGFVLRACLSQPSLDGRVCLVRTQPENKTEALQGLVGQELRV